VQKERRVKKEKTHVRKKRLRELSGSLCLFFGSLTARPCIFLLLSFFPSPLSHHRRTHPAHPAHPAHSAHQSQRTHARKYPPVHANQTLRLPGDFADAVRQRKREGRIHPRDFRRPRGWRRRRARRAFALSHFPDDEVRSPRG
jgi:hypothetical protein